MLLSESDRNITFLSREFKDIAFSLLDSNDDQALISCFVCRFHNLSHLEKNWTKIASMIAVNYQACLKNEFAAWNIYLSFFCEFKVPIQLKYEIENDTYFMRKIVVDNIPTMSSEDMVGYFNDEILGYDLIENYKKNPIPLDLYPRSAIREAIDSLGDIPLGYKEEPRVSRLEKVRLLVEKVAGK